MKKYLLAGLCVTLGLAGIVSAAYQQQGFNQFKENTDSIDFWCQSNCVMLLGDKAGYDSISVKGGNPQGNGMWGYGYLVAGQLYASTLLPAGDHEWSFVDDPIYDQFPKEIEKQLVFLVTGPLKAEDVQVELNNRGFGETLSRTWNRFRKVDQLAPYSINLHYGPYVGGWSWPIFGLIALIITLIVAAIIHKKVTAKHIFRTAMGALIIIMVAGGLRLLYDHISIVAQGHQEFVATSPRTFFDLRDYISVTEQVRQKLDLDNVNAWRGKSCTIYAKAHTGWPFEAHRGSVYLRPCTLVQTGSMADYGLYYNVEPTSATGTNILSGSNFSLYNFRQ